MGMKIVIAHTPGKLRPEVKQLGEDVGAIFEDVSGSDIAYGELIAKLWQRGESFLLCEHDVLPTRPQLEDIIRCPEPWCAGFAWRYSGAVMPGETRPFKPIRERETALFCNKFTADLLRRTPHIIERVKVRWTQVDLALLGGLDAQLHLHEPALTHLRQLHPPWAMEMTEDDWGHVDA